MKKETKKTYLNYSLNIIIIVLILVCGGFIWSMIKGNQQQKEIKVENIKDTLSTKIPDVNIDAKTISAEVYNGSGENRIGKVFTDYLRQKSVDVKKTDNYKTQTVQKTIIMSRNNNINKAYKVGELIGVKSSEIIESTNKDLDIDVTIVIGKDFKTLKPYIGNNN